MLALVKTNPLIMKSIGIKIFVLTLLISAANFNLSAQILKDIERPDVSENKLRLEFEPGLFFNNGRSLSAIYSVTPDNSFAVGVYLMATDIPEQIHKNIFNNVVPNTYTALLNDFIHLHYLGESWMSQDKMILIPLHCIKYVLFYLLNSGLELCNKI